MNNKYSTFKRGKVFDGGEAPNMVLLKYIKSRHIVDIMSRGLLVFCPHVFQFPGGPGV